MSYLDTNHDPNFRIVPCALHQAHGHRFRSRAGVEFGQTIRVPPALVDKYKNGDKKEAAENLKELVYGNLKTLTLTDSSTSLLEVSILSNVFRDIDIDKLTSTSDNSDNERTLSWAEWSMFVTPKNCS